MTISPKEIQQILSEPPYDKFIPFKEYTFATDEKPSYKEVESHFGHIMMDLELNSEEKISTLEIPKDGQWQFYCDHVKDDTEIPSPVYMIDCISKKHDVRLLESLASCIARNRISYRQQFLEGGGIKLLMNYVRDFSNDPNSLDNQNSMPYIFECMHNITNSIKFGPSYFEEYIDEILSILMDLMVKLPFSKNFVLMLGIISGFYISPTQGPIISNIQKTVKLLKRQPSIFWNNLKKVVRQNDQNEIKTLNNFTQMLLLLRNNPKERFHVSIMFNANEYMNSIRDLSNSLFRNSISQYDLDCEILSQFSNKLDINPFSIKSLSKGLKENSKSKQILRSILLSLNDILKNYETASINYDTFIFIHNFLLIRRFHLSNGDNTKLLLTAFSAASNSELIKMPYNGRDITYRQLNANSFFLSDATLKESKISDYGKIYDKMPEDKQVSILNKKIDEYNVYIKKLKEAHHIANAVHFEEEEILGQLKSLRTENQHLKALVASLKEKLSKYEKGGQNVTERSIKGNPSNGNIQLNHLKLQVKELASQMTIENDDDDDDDEHSSDSIIQDLRSQLNQSSKENKELQSKFAKSSNENRNLVSQIEEASNEIKDLKAKVEELQSQLEQTSKGNESLKQTVKSAENQNEDENDAVSIDPVWVIQEESELEVQQRSQTFDNQFVILQSQLEQSSNENKVLQIKFDESSNENRKLVSQIEEANNEIKDLKTKVLELQTQLEQTSKGNEDGSNSTSQQQPTAAAALPKERDVQLQIEQSNSQTEALRAELEQSTLTIENLKKRLQLSESENDRLRNEEITSLKSQLESQLYSKNSSNDDLNSSFDSTELASPIRSGNRSLTENSLILDQLASQQQQIELLRKQLSEYESRNWDQLNPSYDLHNASSDEIQNLREELKNAKEKIDQYKSASISDANTDNEMVEVIKEQLNIKKKENEELKMKLESTLVENSELKERVNQISNSSNNDSNASNNNDNNNDNSMDDSTKNSPSKRRFSFRNLLKK